MNETAEGAPEAHGTSGGVPGAARVADADRVTSAERVAGEGDSAAVPSPAAAPSPALEPPVLTVYYDGGCPLCRREIATYRRAAGAERLDWVDVSSVDGAALGEGLSAERAMARMHVRDAEGRLIDGAAAFAALWSVLPRTRLLGRLARTRPALAVLEPAYRLFLRARPLWR